MRDETSLRRLAEIGIDVYVPRVAQANVRDGSDEPTTTAQARRARVVLLARADDARHALVADVRRAFAFARIDGVVESAVDARRIGDAAALVAFGDALAREAGAALPGPRQPNLAWVTAGEPAALARDASAKRALWSELKRVARAVGAGSAQT